RKISLDPAVSWRGPLGFKVMKVSLCGPHSFDTSTLLPRVVAVAAALPSSGPLAARYCYLFHQAGLFGLLADWAAASGGAGAVASGDSRQATARQLTAMAKEKGRIMPPPVWFTALTWGPSARGGRGGVRRPVRVARRFL